MPDSRRLALAFLLLRVALAGAAAVLILLGDGGAGRNAPLVLLAALLLVQLTTAVFSPSSRGPSLRVEMLGWSVGAIALGTQVALRRNPTLDYIEGMAGGPISLIFVLGMVAGMIGLGTNVYRFFRGPKPTI